MSHPTLQSRGNADTAVVLLTGADRLSLDSVAFSLADSYASVCAISYDVRPNDEADAGLSIVRRVSRPVGQGVGVGDAEIFDLSDCLRDTGRPVPPPVPPEDSPGTHGPDLAERRASRPRRA